MILGPLKDKHSKNYFLEYALIIVSGVLLGIWAVKNTIALRNVLLGIGFIFSLIYMYRKYKQGLLKNIDFKSYFPALCIFLMFAWVLMHLFFLSQYPDIQLQELKSTWLRALMATFLGVATGIALRNHVKLINFLWLGIGLSFVYLLCQYIPKAYIAKNIFAVDWYGGYYIYIGKINGVLMGSILFCGLGAAWIDHLRSKTFVLSFINTFLPFMVMAITLYAYVFIFDTRNGLGISALLLCFWILYAGIWCLRQSNPKKLLLRFKGLVIPVVLVLGVFSWLAYQQVQHNPGWLTILEDAKIASQIEKYPHWQNPGRYGYPKTDVGREVAGNTYERVAWATAALELVPDNILGVGVLTRPFARLIREKYPESTPLSTHSAWIEFTLAFGLPGFLLMFGSLVSILYLAIFSSNFYFKVSTISLALMLLLLYTLGELSTQHGVEVLFYLIALLAGLQMPLIVTSSVRQEEAS